MEEKGFILGINLTDAIGQVLSSVKGKGRVTKINVKEAKIKASTKSNRYFKYTVVYLGGEE